MRSRGFSHGQPIRAVPYCCVSNLKSIHKINFIRAPITYWKKKKGFRNRSGLRFRCKMFSAPTDVNPRAGDAGQYTDFKTLENVLFREEK